MPTLNDIESLLQQIDKVVSINKMIENDRIKRGENFNIFNTLGIQTEEVRLHSRFIAELLNPFGNHGMGGEFLRAFLTLIGKEPSFINPLEVKGSITERYIGQASATEGGRIDIIIEDGNNAIIIENKIYAGDQENQLLRYNKYGINHFKNGKFILVYLTLNGQEASDFSTGGQKRIAKPLSYSSDILNWLDQCVKLSYNKPLVRETIVQYINLIKQLTKMDLDTELIDKLAEIELSNVEAVATLIDYQSRISMYLREKYILEPLKKQYQTKLDSNGLYIFPSQWEKGFILLVIQNGNEVRIEIGLSGGQHAPKTKLDCFECIPGKDGYNPFGFSRLPEEFRNWNSARSYTAMRNGRALDWIEKKIKEILYEVKTKNIRL